VYSRDTQQVASLPKYLHCPEIRCRNIGDLDLFHKFGADFSSKRSTRGKVEIINSVSFNGDIVGSAGNWNLRSLLHSYSHSSYSAEKLNVTQHFHGFMRLSILSSIGDDLETASTKSGIRLSIRPEDRFGNRSKTILIIVLQEPEYKTRPEEQAN